MLLEPALLRNSLGRGQEGSTMRQKVSQIGNPGYRAGWSPGKPRLVRCLVILGLRLLVTAGLQAQTPDPTPLEAPQPRVRPPLSPFPRFQDWSFLRDPSQRVDPYDRLKFI